MPLEHSTSHTLSSLGVRVMGKSGAVNWFLICFFCGLVSVLNVPFKNSSVGVKIVIWRTLSQSL